MSFLTSLPSVYCHEDFECIKDSHFTFGCKYPGIFAETAIDLRVTSNGKKGVREGQIDKLKKLRRLS